MAGVNRRLHVSTLRRWVLSEMVRLFRKSPRAERLHHVHRVTGFAPFVGILRGKYNRWLRDAFLLQDKGKQIVAVSFALETEFPFCLLVRGFCPVLCCALFLPCLDHNFLRVESRATLVSKLYGHVVVEVIVRRATTNIPGTDLDGATKA
jgi:hypothetical protein